MLELFRSKPAVPAWNRSVMMLSDASFLHVFSYALQHLTVTDLSLGSSVSMVSHMVISVIMWTLVNLVQIIIFTTTVLSTPKGFDVITKSSTAYDRKGKQDM
jgi:hypothetical protein